MDDSPILLRYRNREIRGQDLELIGALALRPGMHRQALSRAVCEAWGWRQWNGGWAEYACRDLLLRLEERGLVRLPERTRRRSVRPSRPILPVDLIPVAWLPVRDPVDLKTLIVRPISADERLGFRVFMTRYHYLGPHATIGEQVLHAAFLGNELVALLAWGPAAAHAPTREQYVGWDEATRRRQLALVTNNVRFLVLPWVRVRHLASKVLAASLRRLSRDWKATHGHAVYLAETFVDTARFRGTCYRAANWRYLGQTAGRAKRGNQFTYGSPPKAVFVYDLHRQARRLLRNVERT